MKDKLVFHADKMKIQSILCGLSAVLYELLIIYIDINSNGNFEYWRLIVFSAFNFLPFALCVFIFEYGKRGAEIRKLIKIYALGSAFFVLISIITTLYSNIVNDNISGENILWATAADIICLVFWVLSAVFCEQKRSFAMLGGGVVVIYIYNIFRSICALVVYFTDFHALDNFVDFMKVAVYSSVCGLIQNCLSLACVIIWFFFVFSLSGRDIEKKLEKLNKNYTSGKISKEDYDSERQKIINSI